MNKQDVLDLVGQDAYNKQSEMLWRAAPYMFARKVPVGYDTVLAHDVSDFIWHEEHQDLDDVDRIKLTFDIYRDMPCYALLFEIGLRYNGGSFSQPAQAEIVQHVRSLLADDHEALALPVAYMLAVDVLGDDAVGRDTWNKLLEGDVNTNTLRRLLQISGLVPFDLKYPLYEKLVGDHTWHTYIFDSLRYSGVQLYGPGDKAKVKKLFEKLDVPPDTKGFDQLRAAVA